MKCPRARRHGGEGGSGGGGGRSSGGEASGRWYPQQETAEQAGRKQEATKDRLKRVAEAALEALERRSYVYRGEAIDLREEIRYTIKETVFYPEQSNLGRWEEKPNIRTQGKSEAAVSILNIPTLNAARILTNSYRFQTVGGVAGNRTGVLNFASATQPGGGFKNGAEAQEESIARVSSLYVSLASKDGKKFYDAHWYNQTQYYTHGMIWSPGVIVFQDDYAEGVQAYEIDVISCAAVNAGKILEEKQSWETAEAETKIEGKMRERMGRILYLFELKGVRNIVLGTFGTGVFKNKISEVARIWASLLLMEDSRFRYSFDRVIFAITGDSTFAEFKGRFEGWTKQKETVQPATRTDPVQGSSTQPRLHPQIPIPKLASYEQSPGCLDSTTRARCKPLGTTFFADTAPGKSRKNTHEFGDAPSAGATSSGPERGNLSSEITPSHQVQPGHRNRVFISSPSPRHEMAAKNTGALRCSPTTSVRVSEARGQRDPPSSPPRQTHTGNSQCQSYLPPTIEPGGLVNPGSTGDPSRYPDNPPLPRRSLNEVRGDAGASHGRFLSPVLTNRLPRGTSPTPHERDLRNPPRLSVQIRSPTCPDLSHCNPDETEPLDSGIGLITPQTFNRPVTHSSPHVSSAGEQLNLGQYSSSAPLVDTADFPTKSFGPEQGPVLREERPDRGITTASSSHLPVLEQATPLQGEHPGCAVNYPPQNTYDATEPDTQRASSLVPPPENMRIPMLGPPPNASNESTPLSFHSNANNLVVGIMGGIQAGGNVTMSPRTVVYMNSDDGEWNRKFLSHVAPNAIHTSEAVSSIGTCDEGTRVKLLARITGWVDDKDPSSKALCMTGAVGSGKSAVALTVAKECVRRHVLVASFFFSSSDDTRNDCSRVVTTIAYQLGLQNPSLRDAITDAVSVDPLVFGTSLSTQATKLILEPLRKAGFDSVPGLILLDGIDECVEEEQSRLMAIAKHILETTSFRIFITGRPEVVIRRELEPGGLLDPAHHIRLSDDKEFDATDDIRRTLSLHLPNLTKQDAAELKECIDAIIMASSGQYIYPATVLKYVQQGTLRGDLPKKRLSSVHGWIRKPMTAGRALSFVLSALDQLYRNILLAAVNAHANEPFNTEKGKREIILIVRAFASLQISTVPQVESQSASVHDQLLGLEEGTLHSATCDLRSLVRIRDPKEAGRIVQFYHRTCLDFLRDVGRAGKDGKEMYFPEDRITSYLVKRLGLGFNASENSASANVTARGSFATDEAAWVNCTSASFLGKVLRSTPESNSIRTALVRFSKAGGWEKLEEWIDLVKNHPQLANTDLMEAALLDWRFALNTLQKSEAPGIASASRKLLTNIGSVGSVRSFRS